MRLLIAVMKHQTNTFSPVPTPLGPIRKWRRGATPWHTGDRRDSFTARFQPEPSDLLARTPALLS